MADVVDPRADPRDYIFIKRQGTAGSVPFDRKLLASRSQFFDTAGRNEDGLTIVTLPEHLRMPGIITIYLDYISFNRIHTEYLSHKTWTPYKEYPILIELYLLGQHVEDSALQDDVMDALLARFNEGDSDGKPWLPSKDDIAKVYEHTPTGSPLRNLLVDIHLWAASVGPKSDRTHDVFLSELLAEAISQKAKDNADDKYEAAAALIEGGTKKGVVLKLKAPAEGKQVAFKIPTGVSCCDYHKHEVGVICGNKKRKREVEEEAERAPKRYLSLKLHSRVTSASMTTCEYLGDRSFASKTLTISERVISPRLSTGLVPRPKKRIHLSSNDFSHCINHATIGVE